MDFFVGSSLEELGMSFQDMFGNFFSQKKEKERKSYCCTGKKNSTQTEAQKLIDMDESD